MYESEGLGYIVAEHQTREATDGEGPSVLTYYLPFDREPDIKRRELLDKGHDFWVNEIMKDLWEMHPGIEKDITRIDLYKWGHAMIRPTPNFIWGPDRGLRGHPFGRIFFGNADVTGLPLFEEACYSGHPCGAGSDGYAAGSLCEFNSRGCSMNHGGSEN